jgi:hypothetical protein
MMARAVDFSISPALQADLEQWRTRAQIAGIAGALLTALGFFLTSPNQFYRSYLCSYIFVVAPILRPLPKRRA